MRFPAAGGATVEMTLHSLRLYRATTSLHIFVLLFEIIYVGYTAYFIIHEIKAVRRLKWAYFSNVTGILDFTACLLSVTVIALYIAFSVRVHQAVQTYQSDSGDIVARFQQLAILDLALAYIFGLLLVVGMLKFIHLLRFNPLIYRLQLILTYAAPRLFWAMVLVLAAFFTFGIFLHVVMGSQVYWFSSLRLTFASFFEGLLGVLYMDQLTHFHSVWGPLLYIGILVILLLCFFNVLVAVLMEAVVHVNQQKHQPLEDTELLWLLVHKCVQWLGISHRTM